MARRSSISSTRRVFSTIEVAETIARILESLGFYVARHASNLLVMYSEKLLGSIHIYEDNCVFRVNPAWERDYIDIIERIKDVMKEVCRWRKIGL